LRAPSRPSPCSSAPPHPPPLHPQKDISIDVYGRAEQLEKEKEREAAASAATAAAAAACAAAAAALAEETEREAEEEEDALDALLAG
jgi:hypothetical protein